MFGLVVMAFVLAPRSLALKLYSLHFGGESDSNDVSRSEAALRSLRALIDPPSTEPYRSNQTSYSQAGQDRILEPVLGRLGKGFFVESGALDGEFHSNTMQYEKQGWSGLLVEPDPRFFQKIHANAHRHAYAFNGCLSPTGRAETLQFDVERIPGWSKLVNNGQNASDEIASYPVAAQPLQSLLAAIDQTVVDFWSLDVEGSEGKILKNTDFSKVEVGVLLVEMNKNGDNNKDIREVMTKEGFINIGHTGEAGPLDQIFINPKYFQKRGKAVPTSDALEAKYRN